MDKGTIIFETVHFELVRPVHPHIDRADGGHLYIVSKNEAYSSLTDLPTALAEELIRFAQRAGRAMMDVLKDGGVDIEMINYQMNGNWSAKLERRDPLHMHLYGRARAAKRQPFGEALSFPLPETGCYDGLTPLTDADLRAIADALQRSRT